MSGKRSIPLFNILTIVGPGLIGSSILRCAQQYPGIAKKTIAVDKDPDVIERVRKLHICDIATTSLEEGVCDADCVILCIPVGAIAKTAIEALTYMKPGSILSDVSSVRSHLSEEISPYLKDISYVPSHPMAGTEFSGPESGFSSLFKDQWCLLTPSANTNQGAIKAITKLWQLCGARTTQLDANEHDRICAMVSHLPHLIAYSMCDSANNLSNELGENVLSFAASGFKSFTRVAASDPTMWHDIFLANKDILLETLEQFQTEIGRMVTAIKNKDSKEIKNRLKRERNIRKTLI